MRKNVKKYIFCSNAKFAKCKYFRKIKKCCGSISNKQLTIQKGILKEDVDYKKPTMNQLLRNE